MTLYLLLATGLLLVGCHGLFTSEGMLRKLLALNVLSSSAFLMFVAIARMSTPLDPVPHAIVLTGLVVTVSTTAVALALVIRLAVGGSPESRGRREEEE